MCEEKGKELESRVNFYQSNNEGEIINKIHEAKVL